jgi:hypothetical protein
LLIEKSAGDIVEGMSFPGPYQVVETSLASAVNIDLTGDFGRGQILQAAGDPRFKAKSTS